MKPPKDANADIEPTARSEASDRDQKIDALIELAEASVEAVAALIPARLRNDLREKCEKLKGLHDADSGR